MTRLFTDAASCCPLCARPGSGNSVCGGCQNTPPPYRAFWASLRYRAPLPALLHEFKHTGRLEYGRALAELMTANPPPWLRTHGTDGVLAMPVSRLRRLERGFNQCDELAAWLARRHTLPLLPPGSVQRSHKPPQSTLPAAERQKNVRNAFQAADIVKNRKILIIDDLKTTGATLSELARTLNRTGAAAVFVWVAACN